MNITDIRVRRTYQDTRLKALVSVTIDNDLAVHDIKVIEGPERLFVAMPSRKDDNSVFRDICHPITPQARGTLESAILSAYHEYLERASAEVEPPHHRANGESSQSAVAWGPNTHSYSNPDAAGHSM
ncbi:MAG: SpoVG family protein [Oscillospiraceae bacterium]|nr:SpoVG family protein [Oscillospiraceae bacterium]